MDDHLRCAWVPQGDDLYRDYHDLEWGVPVHDDRHHFEMLTLEGAQAGLSWATILKRREGYRAAFVGFDAERVAAFDERDVERLLADTGIVRNRLKVESAIANARALLELWGAGGSLSELMWSATGGVTLDNRCQTMADVPAETPASKALSKELKRRGFRFVGPTTIYAHMQAAGIVNDHTLDCFRHPEVARLRPAP